MEERGAARIVVRDGRSAQRFPGGVRPPPRCRKEREERGELLEHGRLFAHATRDHGRIRRVIATSSVPPIAVFPTVMPTTS